MGGQPWALLWNAVGVREEGDEFPCEGNPSGGQAMGFRCAGDTSYVAKRWVPAARRNHPTISDLLIAERFLPSQQMMIMLGEAVGFVADVLQQPQGVGVAAEAQGFVAVREIDELFALGERQ